MKPGIFSADVTLKGNNHDGQRIIPQQIQAPQEYGGVGNGGPEQIESYECNLCIDRCVNKCIGQNCERRCEDKCREEGKC